MAVAPPAVRPHRCSVMGLPGSGHFGLFGTMRCRVGQLPGEDPPPPPPPLSCQGSQRPRFHPARGDVGQRRGASAQGHDAAWTRTRGIPSGHEKAPAPSLCLSTEGAGMLYDDALGRGHQEHLVWHQWPVHTRVEP